MGDHDGHIEEDSVCDLQKDDCAAAATEERWGRQRTAHRSESIALDKIRS